MQLIAWTALGARHSRRAHFAYGPALCPAGLLALLAGPPA